MKNILLTAAAVAAISSSSAMAGWDNMSDCLYVKAHVGATKYQKQTNGYKSDTDGKAELAVGYYIMDNLRADLSIDYAFDPEFKRSNATNREVVKFDASSLLLNVYMDVFDFGMAKAFAGVGAGVSRVRSKYSNTVVATSTTTTVKFKSSHEFTYAAYLGVAAEVDKGIHIEAMYQFKGMGKDNNNTQLRKRLNAHTGSIGVRFDI